MLDNKSKLTNEDVIQYKEANPQLNSADLVRKIIKEGGLYQYNNFATMLRIVQRTLKQHRKDITNSSVKRLFVDIETSPNIGLFWRAGFKQTIMPENIIKERAIICICWKWEGEDKVHSLEWDNKQCDKAMLEEFAKVLKQAHEVVAHNGDRFDLKWFNTRCLYHRINILPKYKTLDTLKKAKSHFYFNSNKLDYIAKFLGVGGKMATGGFDLWKNIVLNQCSSSMDKMVEYCQNDVIILEDVYHALSSYITTGVHHGVHKGGNKWDCPQCGSVNVNFVKNDTTRRGTIQRWMGCGDCNHNYVLSNRVYQKFVENKYKNKADM